MTETTPWPRHVVAAGALIRKESSVLLVRTLRRGWETPGGQIEENESLLAGIRREIAEETHIDAKIDSLAGVNANLTTSRLIFDFVGTWVSGEPAGSDETLEATWVPDSEALALVEHPMYRLRIEHLLRFDGRLIYRAYSTEPFEIIEERFL